MLISLYNETYEVRTMPEKDEKGQIVITIEDIYNQQNELSESVRELSQKFDRVTHKLENAQKIEEISREALKIANEANDKADRALENDKTEEEQKREFRNMWIKALLATFVPWVLTLLVGVIILLGKGGLI